MDLWVGVALLEEGVQVAIGNQKVRHSPIVHAITEAESNTTGEIRVHLSRRWFEKDPCQRALKLFHRFGMTRTTHRNAVLLYVNLRRRKFAVIGDEGIHQAVGQKYWQDLAEQLRQDLHSTQMENAIALAVLTIGKTLRQFFPADSNSPHHNELPNDVSED